MQLTTYPFVPTAARVACPSTKRTALPVRLGMQPDCPFESECRTLRRRWQACRQAALEGGVVEKGIISAQHIGCDVRLSKGLHVLPIHRWSMIYGCGRKTAKYVS